MASKARERLLGRIDNAEVLLVHGPGSQPDLPLVRRKEDQNTDVWVVESGLGLSARLNVDLMVKHACQSRAIWAPIITTVQTTPQPEVV